MGTKRIKLKRNPKHKGGPQLLSETMQDVPRTPESSMKAEKVVHETGHFTESELNEITWGNDEPIYEFVRYKEKGWRKSPEELIQLRRRCVLRMMLRAVPYSVIADYLNVDRKTVYRDKSKIEDEMREEMNNIDMPLFVGKVVSFYDEIKFVAMTKAHKAKNNDTSLRALRLAMDAEGEKHKYLTLTGLYGVAAKNNTLFRNISTVGSSRNTDDQGDFQKFLAAFAEAAEETDETIVSEG